MAWKDLEHFLVDVSMNPNLRMRFDADPDAVMDGYRLSTEEKALVKSKNADAIKKYLGDQYTAAMKIDVAE